MVGALERSSTGSFGNGGMEPCGHGCVGACEEWLLLACKHGNMGACEAFEFVSTVHWHDGIVLSRQWYICSIVARNNYAWELGGLHLHGGMDAL